jgi:isopenicillin N synthase-like dioxygenase
VDKKRDGIRATNLDHGRHDQVHRPQEYHLAESADGADAFDDELTIRCCDFGLYRSGDPAAKRRFAIQLGEALSEIGFAILENTGIEPELYDEATERIIDFFESTPLEDKMRFVAKRHGSVKQGYFPIRETSAIHPDLVEGWVFCRRAFDVDPDRPAAVERFWPRPEAEPLFRRLVQCHEPLILPIMHSVLTYLGQDSHLYDDRLTGTNFGLRLNYYPPLADDDDRSGAGRLLGHEDVDLFTLLPAPAVEGLQVLNRRNGKWVRVTAPRGAMVINTGDYMQRITNDMLPSTTHRVSKPRDPTERLRPRASFPMAVYVWENELLEVLPGLGRPKYEPIPAIRFHTRTTSKFYGDDYAVDREP